MRLNVTNILEKSLRKPGEQFDNLRVFLACGLCSNAKSWWSILTIVMILCHVRIIFRILCSVTTIIMIQLIIFVLCTTIPKAFKSQKWMISMCKWYWEAFNYTWHDAFLPCTSTCRIAARENGCKNELFEYQQERTAA